MEDVSAHHATDVIHLNVGGKKYATLFETIVGAKSSFFNRFVRIDITGKVLLFRRNVMMDADGAIFINRDGDLFAHVLQFMRDGKRTVLPEKAYTLRQLLVS
ncbi:K+ channel tetramerization domain protein [Ancylostoma caninum]|uniref:K+ channel tetramerization domain protein n=1 Tax=Ancylostoma caninum TaxID=29170 RepID=A0A368GUZ5_ANCCA|nr:K+ channel tetramerization domain protein [Ancylostoma caninum]